MPELAKPLSLFGRILNEQRSSKSPTVPPVQIRKVLPLAGFSVVVWPVIAPSLTDHSLGLPSQPLRSLPLKMLLNPVSSCAALKIPVCKNRIAPTISAPDNLFRLVFIAVHQCSFVSIRG